MKLLRRLFVAAESPQTSDELNTRPSTPRASALYSVIFEANSGNTWRVQREANLPPPSSRGPRDEPGKVSFFARAGDHCLPLESGWCDQNSLNESRESIASCSSVDYSPTLGGKTVRGKGRPKQLGIISQRKLVEPTSCNDDRQDDDSEDDWILVDQVPKEVQLQANSRPKQHKTVKPSRLRQMALDKLDIDLIRESWKPVTENPIPSGLLLFKELFTKFPEYKDFFSKFADLDLERMGDHKKIKNHAGKVIDKINYVVESIGNNDRATELGERLTKLVQSHLDKGIGVPEFRNLGIVLIDFICDINRRGAKLDTNLLVTAWTKLYSIILDLVKSESERE